MRKVVAATILALAPLALHASPPKKAPAGGAARVSALRFDPAIRSLPVGFKGASLLPLVDTFDPTEPPTKGEFESTQDFARRVARERSLFGSWIAAALTEPTTLTLTYDADAERFSVRLAGTTVDAKDGRMVVGFAVQSHAENKDERVGQNAFGATVRIRYVDTTRIQLGSWADLLVTGSEGVLEETLPVPRGRAKAVKENVRGLIVFRAAAMPEGIGTRRLHEIEATFDSPYEGTFEEVLVYTEEASLWLYLPTTGEILARWPLSKPHASTESKE